MNSSELLELMTKVVNKMGPEWSIKRTADPPNAIRVSGPAPLWISSSEGKLHISADIGWGNESLSKHLYSSDSRPSIAVSASKSPEVIAKDIKRRIVDDVAKLVETLNARKAESEDYTQTSLDSANRLIEASNGTLEIHRNWCKEGQVSIDTAHGTMQSRGDWYLGNNSYVSGDSVTLELRSVPIKRAIRIAQILGEKL